MIDDERLSQLCSTYRECFKRYVSDNGYEKSGKEYESALDHFLHLERKDRETMADNTGYITARRVKITRKGAVPWIPPSPQMLPQEGVWLLGKDLVSFTRDPKEAFKIEGSRSPLPRTEIDFIMDGWRYGFIRESVVDSYLAEHPPARKSISKKERDEVYAKFDGRCAYCGKPIEYKEMQVDHIVSHMSHMGKDEVDNYFPACPVCNRVKCSSTLDGFRSRIRRCGEIHRARKKPMMADSDKIAVSYGLTKEDHEIEFYFEEKEKWQ